jgi:hypothetical protein
MSKPTRPSPIAQPDEWLAYHEDVTIPELEAENAKLRETNQRLADELCKGDDQLTTARELLREFPHLAADEYRAWRFGVSAFLTEMEDTHD